MAVLLTATASGKQMYAGTLGTLSSTLYTAPAASANVVSPSATAYIKEIIIANTTGSAATVTLTVAGVTILGALSVGANDTKVLGGLNIMIPASNVVTALASVASTINLYVSGVEIQ